MSSPDLERRLDAIEGKLDLLVEQIEVTQRQQRELKELREDLSRIGVDVFQSFANELEDVAPYFETGDLVHLVKKLMRNTRNLTKMLDQLEGLMDFFDDAAPLQKAAFLEVLQKLDEMDQKGYFQFLAEVPKMVDNVVETFNPEDARLLSENLVTILLTVRNFTQPDILQAINNALSIYKNLDFVVEEDISYLKLLREIRTPELKRGIAVGMQFLKNVSALDEENQVPILIPPPKGRDHQPASNGNGSNNE